MEKINLQEALELFSLPRNLGVFEKLDVIVSEGRYGPYIKYNGKFISLTDQDPMRVSLATCVEVLKSYQKKQKEREINSFDHDDVKIEVLNGRYGPYIKSGKKNYKIPKNLDPAKITIDDCLNLISKSAKK